MTFIALEKWAGDVEVNKNLVMRHLAFLMNEELYIQHGKWDSSGGIVTRRLDV